MASIQLQGDNSGSLTIQAPSDAGNNTLTLPATSSTLATQNALGVRNLIINGDMQIAQRGTSATGKNTGGYYTVDRFGFFPSGLGTWTNTQSTDIPTGQGFTHSFKLECTVAAASLVAAAAGTIQQRIEGQNCQYLNYGTASAKTTTLSFWVKSNKTGTYNFNLKKDDDNRRIVKQYTISAANTWEKKTITIAGDTTGAINNDNGIGLQLTFWLGGGSDYTSGSVPSGWSAASTTDYAPNQVNLADSTSNYINITGVQLEVGDTATPFAHRPYDMELARCQRYYEKSYNTGTVPGTVTHIGAGSSRAAKVSTIVNDAAERFRVSKRTDPTVTWYSPVTGASGVISAGNIERTVSGTQFQSENATGNPILTVAPADGDQLYSHYTADSEL